MLNEDKHTEIENNNLRRAFEVHERIQKIFDILYERLEIEIQAIIKQKYKETP